MITFEEYIDNNKIAFRIAKQGYYDIDSVKSNFYKVLDILGKFDKRSVSIIPGDIILTVEL